MDWLVNFRRLGNGLLKMIRCKINRAGSWVNHEVLENGAEKSQSSDHNRYQSKGIASCCQASIDIFSSRSSDCRGDDGNKYGKANQN